jgi:hypothetical protein
LWFLVGAEVRNVLAVVLLHLYETWCNLRGAICHPMQGEEVWFGNEYTEHVLTAERSLIG